MEDFVQNKYGYCFYEIGPSTIIYNLYVHPEYRRQGKATMLLWHVINEIREMGYAGDISIEASPKEDSISIENLRSFYEKMDLKII